MVSPLLIGAALRLWVMIVPVLFIAAAANVYAAISSTAAALVLLFNVVTVRSPLAVCVPLVFPNVSVV